MYNLRTVFRRVGLRFREILEYVLDYLPKSPSDAWIKDAETLHQFSRLLSTKRVGLKSC